MNRPAFTTAAVLMVFVAAAQAQTTRFTLDQAIARAKAAIAQNAEGHDTYCTGKAESSKADAAAQAAYVKQCVGYGAQTEARRSCRADAIDNGLEGDARSQFMTVCAVGAGVQ